MKKLLTIFFATLLLASCSDDENNGSTEIALDVNWPAEQFFDWGTPATFDMTLEGTTTLAITKPEGWIVTYTADKVTVTPPADAAQGALSGTIVLTAGSGSDAKTKSIVVNGGSIVTFEGIGNSYLVSTIDGSELLNGEGYEHQATGLKFMINDGEYGFGAGGVAISQWNDMETEIGRAHV